MEQFLGRCADCPNVKSTLEELEAAREFTQSIQESAISPMLDQYAPEIIQSFEGSPLSVMLGDAANSPEEFTSFIRKNTVRLADDLDEQITTLEFGIETVIKDCKGPLKMRASKDGREITVTACNSPQAPDGDQTEVVTVNRS